MRITLTLASTLMFATAFSFAAMAQSGNPAAKTLAERCPNSVSTYPQLGPPKAFAESSNGHCGYDHSSTLEVSKAKAIANCAARGGINCRITRSQP